MCVPVLSLHVCESVDIAQYERPHLCSFIPGFFCIRYPELMLEMEAKQVYQEWLTKDCSSKKKCQVCGSQNSKYM